MRIAEVIGTVTLGRRHPSLEGARWKIVVPLSLAELAGGARGTAEELVAYDEFGAGLGHRVALSEGAEAAQPFHPDAKPIDAYCAAILDRLAIGPTER